MRLRLPLPLLAALAICSIVAGCGGGSDDESNSSAASNGSGASTTSEGSTGANGGSALSNQPIVTSSLTKAQYVREANAACEEATSKRGAEIKAYNNKNANTPEPERILNLLKQVYVPSMGAQTVALRELGAPAGSEQQIEKMVVAFEEWVAEIKRANSAAALAELNRTINRAADLARKYNLLECTWG